jgi:hypothetical protein
MEFQLTEATSSYLNRPLRSLWEARLEIAGARNTAALNLACATAIGHLNANDKKVREIAKIAGVVLEDAR